MYGHIKLYFQAGMWLLSAAHDTKWATSQSSSSRLSASAPCKEQRWLELSVYCGQALRSQRHCLWAPLVCIFTQRAQPWFSNPFILSSFHSFMSFSQFFTPSVIIWCETIAWILIPVYRLPWQSTWGCNAQLCPSQVALFQRYQHASVVAISPHSTMKLCTFSSFTDTLTSEWALLWGP